MTAPARDLLSSRRFAVLVYAGPTVAIIATATLGAPEALFTVVWTLGFTLMGVACVLNAVRCGRVHCYFTGPFLLLLAAAGLLLGLRVISFGPHGWDWLGVVAAVGTILLLTVPERVWGRYR